MLRAVDSALMNFTIRPDYGWPQRVFVELLCFGVKQVRACLFPGLFFMAAMMIPRMGIWGIPRYDLLLVFALLIQLFMVITKLESVDELKAITLFHVIGFALEAFKTSSAIGSWSYPDPGYTKVLGVPLFSGFMYAAVGSYIIQAWRLFELRIKHHPPYWMSVLIASLIYANFFTHHFIGDYRWHIAACTLGLYARSVVIYRPVDRDRRMPLLAAFLLIGFFLWVAENLSTFLDVWQYPHQLGAWSLVHLGKWSSWSLLVIMTFTIVASLKQMKATIHVAE